MAIQQILLNLLLKPFGHGDKPTNLDSYVMINGLCSNSCRSRLWRLELQKLADELDIEIVVCHYPTGASKWNPVEHRLFSYISINWAGRPLYSFDEALGLIRNTTTSTGLTVTANWIDKVYETGRKVTDPVFKTLNIVKRQICPQWNYRVSPRIVAT